MFVDSVVVRSERVAIIKRNGQMLNDKDSRTFLVTNLKTDSFSLQIIR